MTLMKKDLQRKKARYPAATFCRVFMEYPPIDLLTLLSCSMTSIRRSHGYSATCVIDGYTRSVGSSMAVVTQQKTCHMYALFAYYRNEKQVGGRHKTLL
jgi:hypothetical protein